MHHFFLSDTPLQVDQTIDLASIAHQLFSVLRLQPGGQINLLDGSGYAFITEITHLARNQGVGIILEKVLVASEPRHHLTLYQCSLKGDKFEWVLQKGTELGVSQFVPVISERSVVRPSSTIEKKYERWQKIIQEAAEQCGRGRLPELATPLSIKAALLQGSGLKILPWEAVAAQGTLRQTPRPEPVAGYPVDGIGGLQQTQAKGTQLPQETESRLQTILERIDRRDGDLDKVALLIGPEGGLSGCEVNLARESNWHIASLGPRILRAETAAIAASAIIMDTLG